MHNMNWIPIDCIINLVVLPLLGMVTFGAFADQSNGLLTSRNIHYQQNNLTFHSKQGFKATNSTLVLPAALWVQ